MLKYQTVKQHVRPLVVVTSALASIFLGRIFNPTHDIYPFRNLWKLLARLQGWLIWKVDYWNSRYKHWGIERSCYLTDNWRFVLVYLIPCFSFLRGWVRFYHYSRQSKSSFAPLSSFWISSGNRRTGGSFLVVFLDYFLTTYFLFRHFFFNMKWNDAVNMYWILTSTFVENTFIFLLKNIIFLYKKYIFLTA